MGWDGMDWWVGLADGNASILSLRPPPQLTTPARSTPPQDNVHIGCFTVRETLHFASLLRVREGASEQERGKRVEDVMMMLGLEGVADVLVGDALRKGVGVRWFYLYIHLLYMHRWTALPNLTHLYTHATPRHTTQASRAGRRGG
jgi:hypothetical protein